MRRYAAFLPLNLLSVCCCLSALCSTAMSASYLTDHDWSGADLTLQDGDEIAGEHINVGTFTVPAGATVFVYAHDDDTGQYGSVKIHAASAIIAGAFTADGAGHAATKGPGAATGRNGAAHGGRSIFAQEYGSPDAPDKLGSGGGTQDSHTGTAGGGAILIDATGEIEVSGVLSANGQGQPASGRAGSGSGGSIWLKASRIFGDGSVTADGGDASASYATPAAGGRIAFDTTQNDFTGVLRARSGAGKPDTSARAGTFNFKSDPDLDLVILHDIALPPGTDWVFKSLTVANNAIFEIQSVPGSVEEDYTDEIASRLRILGNVTVEEDSSISANGLGYWTAQGPGAATGRSAAGYGGRGSCGEYGRGTSGIPGLDYGQPGQPDRLGSGGGADVNGNAGGGAVILDVDGVLRIDGTISANGARSNYRGGGGSGGIGIWLQYDGFTGVRPGTYVPYTASTNERISVAGGLGGASPAENGAPGTFHLIIPIGTMFTVQ